MFWIYRFRNLIYYIIVFRYYLRMSFYKVEKIKRGKKFKDMEFKKLDINLGE